MSSLRQLAREHARLLAFGLAAARIGNGCFLLFFPGAASCIYFGPRGRVPAVRVLGRFVGIRDVVTGGVAVRALITGRGDVEAVAAAAAVEGFDAAISVLSPGAGWRMRVLSVTAVGAAGLGAVAAQGLAADRAAGSTG